MSRPGVATTSWQPCASSFSWRKIDSPPTTAAAESATPEWLARRNTYEEALGQFEKGHFGPACRTVYPLLASMEGNFDVPCLNLVTRSVEHIKYPPENLEKFDGVVELTSK